MSRLGRRCSICWRVLKADFTRQWFLNILWSPLSCFQNVFAQKRQFCRKLIYSHFLHNIIQSEKILLFVKKQQFSSLLSKMMIIEKTFFNSWTVISQISSLETFLRKSLFAEETWAHLRGSFLRLSGLVCIPPVLLRTCFAYFFLSRSYQLSPRHLLSTKGC